MIINNYASHQIHTLCFFGSRRLRLRHCMAIIVGLVKDINQSCPKEQGCMFKFVRELYSQTSAAVVPPRNIVIL